MTFDHATEKNKNTDQTRITGPQRPRAWMWELLQQIRAFLEDLFEQGRKYLQGDAHPRPSRPPASIRWFALTTVARIDGLLDETLAQVTKTSRSGLPQLAGPAEQVLPALEQAAKRQGRKTFAKRWQRQRPRLEQLIRQPDKEQLDKLLSQMREWIEEDDAQLADKLADAAKALVSRDQGSGPEVRASHHKTSSAGKQASWSGAVGTANADQDPEQMAALAYLREHARELLPPDLVASPDQWRLDPGSFATHFLEVLALRGQRDAAERIRRALEADTAQERARALLDALDWMNL